MLNIIKKYKVKMKINPFKVLLTFPYVLWVIVKAKRWKNRLSFDEKSLKESIRYAWVKKIAKFFLWLSNVKVKIANYDNWVDGACVIMSNHQSNIDPLVLFSINNFKLKAPLAFIAKISLKSKNIVESFLRLIDIIYIDRSNLRQSAKALIYAKDLINLPRAMAIFPEGTRNNSEKKLLDFKAGAFKVPQKAYAPIIPTTIVNSYQCDSKSKFSFKKIYIIFHPPIYPEKFISSNTNILSKIVQKKVKEGLDNFEKFKKISFSYKKTIKNISKIDKKKKKDANLTSNINLFKKKKKNKTKK